MIEKIIIAGAGGQGIMLLGKVIAEAALKERKCVTWFPCYGAEVRGGTAYCMVIVSDREVSSPLVEKADTLIIMNEPSFSKFRERINKDGLLLINSSLIKNGLSRKAGRVASKNLAFPFTGIAAKLGNIKVANMVALGSFVAEKKILRPQTIRRVIIERAPRGNRQIIEINKKALEEGLRLK